MAEKEKTFVGRNTGIGLVVGGIIGAIVYLVVFGILNILAGVF